ncbi:borealin-2-like isoform X2 [Phaenicophaeus curvirostris]|uniref:borealin-2-like isoform X2 n=1 Tax=Phaenicophaeus curvirostris TaxID=33595 RepID=UPI0037F0C4EA
MAPREPSGQRGSEDSGVEPGRAARSQEKKDRRLALFLNDFDQQARESVREMRKELESVLQTAEKALAVELLRVPAAVRRARRKALLDLQEREEVALAAAAVTDCSLEDIPTLKLVRTNSKKVKVTTIVEYEDAKDISAKKISKKVSKTKSLVSLASGLNSKLKPLSRSAHSSGNVAAAVTCLTSDCTTNFKAKPKTSKSARLQQTDSRTTPASGRDQGMLLRSKSISQDKTRPFVNIPLADGQTLCATGGDLHNIDVQLLHQDTVQHIHNLVV